MRKLDRLFGTILLACALLAALPAGADVGRRATVQDDGTLRIGGKTVHLYGISTPTLDYTCQTTIRPATCAPRAALQLDFKINGFVYCERVHRNADGSETAVCRTGRDREDLAAYLLYRGLAVARPGAPIEYVTLERFAQANHRGFWGFQADISALARRGAVRRRSIGPWPCGRTDCCGLVRPCLLGP